VQDLVQQVGGDRVEARSVVPPGADPHTYQPTPRDIQALQGARLAVWNGLGLDETAADLVAEQGLPDLTVVVLSTGITPLAGDEHAHEDEADHADADEPDHGHAHAGGNPHLWLDPAYAIRYVQTIRDALIEVDPTNAEAYRANATAFVGEIEALDAWAKGEMATIPPERRKLVTFHDAFPYFAAHYDLELVGVVLKSPGREPSAQEIAALVTEIRQHQIPAVYAEPQFNARILDLAARDAGIQVRRLYSDAFDGEVRTYLDLMRFNVTSVVEGLR
jgi:zinc/manganese transport system substrate-binding protein/manganese/iron transport system substrate-binding protein